MEEKQQVEEEELEEEEMSNIKIFIAEHFL